MSPDDPELSVSDFIQIHLSLKENITDILHKWHFSFVFSSGSRTKIAYICHLSKCCPDLFRKQDGRDLLFFQLQQDIIFFELAELKKDCKYLLSAGITWSREVHICRNTCEEDFMLFVI